MLNEKSNHDQLLFMLANGCESMQLAKYALAFRSHAEHNSAMMIKLECDSYFLEIAENYVDDVESLVGTELLRADFNAMDHDDELVALIFDAVGLVILCYEHNGEFEPYSIEPLCAMTAPNFFKYLNTIPNPYLYAITDKPMLNATSYGIQLLKELAEEE